MKKSIISAGLMALTLGAFGATCTFDGAWDTVPSDPQDAIVVLSGDLTWGAALPARVASWRQEAGTVTFETTFDPLPSGMRNVTPFPRFEVTGGVVLNGGTWTHPADTTAEAYRLNVLVYGDMTVSAQASLDTTRKGFKQGGAGRAARGVEGAAHGGRGHNQYSGERTVCFGSIREPVRIGSTANRIANVGSEAGGAVCLTVGGQLTLNGAILADGSGSGGGYYAGSGGSVWVTAGSLTAGESARVSANAGSGPGYAGGGGRVSICLTDAAADFSGFAGTATAYGAIKNGVAYTGAGTVYFETSADGYGKGRLVVDGQNIANGDWLGTELIFADQVEGFSPSVIEVKNKGRLLTWDTGALSPKKVVFSGGGRLVVGLNCTLDLSLAEFSADSADGGVFISNPVELNLGTNPTITGGSLWISSPDVSCACQGLLTLRDGGTLCASYPFTLSCNVRVASGGCITHLANLADKLNVPTTDYRVDLTIDGNLRIEEGGRVSAKACGYPACVGIGASPASGWGGGAHGGGSTGYSGVRAYPCYGSLTRPIEIGAGTAYSGQYGAAGGGAVRLVVSGNTHNDGLIDADGVNASNLGSSPGGSVWLVTGTLSGRGKIEANANGENCLTITSTHNTSGGGRVSVWLMAPGADFTNFSEGMITAYGARRTSADAAAPGTVYLKTGDQGETDGRLIVDNGGVKASPRTEIGDYVTDTVVGDVQVSDDASLALVSSGHLTVRGNLACAGTLTASDDSELEFAGTGVSNVDCSFSVPRLTCTAPGKSIVVADGAKLAVTQKLTLEGADGAPVCLLPAEGAAGWNLTVASTAEQSVKHVRVEKCDASGGARIVATDSKVDDVSQNWSVINIVKGQVVTWTGGAGAPDWALAENWDVQRTPVETDDIRIESSALSPVLTGATRAYRLTVAEGMTLSLQGYDLVVDGELTVNGRLECSGGEQISVSGDAVFAQKGFGARHSTLTLDGSGAQLFAGGGNAFHHLVFANTSAEGVTVGSSFEVDSLTAEATVPTAIAFADGVTATVGSMLTLSGDAGTRALTLKPAVEGATWNLDVKGVAALSGLSVSGSRATGNDLYASDSTDLGANDGWHFGLFGTSTWTGATSDDFADPSNWSDGRVPDENDAVRIDSAKPVTVYASVRVRELVLGGSAVSSLTVKAPLNVSGAVLLRDRSTVVADALLSVGGSLVMEDGAVVTHSANSDREDFGLAIEVDGNLSVSSGATIDVTGKGFVNGGPGRSGSSGGSYGGMGGTHNTPADCYGSIFCPTNCGSSGNHVDPTASGGGVVRVSVAGKLRVDGTISADGAFHQADWYAGSGGSVWITCGQLLGTGLISANGGRSGSGYHGAGGRVALYMTDEDAVEADFDGSLQAYPGELKGAPGTVYVQTATDRPYGGEIRMVNAPTASEFGGQDKFGYLQYPSPRLTRDPKRIGASLVLQGYVRFSLMDDVRVASLDVLDNKPKVFLNGHVLKINQPMPKDWTLPSYVIPGEDSEGNPGRIVWATGLIVIFH